MVSIAKKFFVFDRFLGAAPLGSGNINDTFLLEYEVGGSQKQALLQRINHQVFRQPEVVMDNTLRVCQYLKTQDYPYQIAAPVSTLDGNYLHQDEAGNYWRAFPFIAHSYAPEGISSPGIAYEAARAYGAFARALARFPANTLAETIPGFHDTDQRWQVFLQILQEDPVGRVPDYSSEIASMFEAKPVFDQISALKRSGQLPLRVAHNDTKAGNVLFDRSTHKALAVIDLDTVMPGTLLSDFGDMVRTFCPDCLEDAVSSPILRPEVLTALKQGFLEETEGFITNIEKENLMLGAAWMIGEQALRFLTDWFAGDVYYKISSPEHNLNRARNQLALFKRVRLET